MEGAGAEVAEVAAEVAPLPVVVVEEVAAVPPRSASGASGPQDFCA